MLGARGEGWMGWSCGNAGLEQGWWCVCSCIRCVCSCSSCNQRGGSWATDSLSWEASKQLRQAESLVHGRVQPGTNWPRQPQQQGGV